MKHTLFLTTMLAAALLGGQVFAEPVVYSVYKHWSYGQKVDISGTEATVLVDAQKTLYSFDAFYAQSLTLDYQGDFVLTMTDRIDTPYNGVLNITTTKPSVATDWEEAFSADGGGSITLCSAGLILMIHGPVQFFGTDADNTVQLGNTEVKFMGKVASKDALAMNQVGIMWDHSDISLVGKVVKGVPEPTTGSLSLLALAGLCARRRK